MSKNYETIVIPAQVGSVPGVFRFEATASVFACVSALDGTSAAATFQVRPDNQDKITQSSGRGFGNPGGKQWQVLTFYNTLATAVTVVFWTGDAEFVPDRTTTSNIASLNVTVTSVVTHKATTLSGSGILNLASGATSAAITNVNGKQFLVRNHASSAGNLEIQDNAGAVLDVLAPGDPAWSLETSGTFKLKATGGACDYSYGKVIYT